MIAYTKEHATLFPELEGRITFAESKPETCGSSKPYVFIMLYILVFMINFFQ